ncbi:MAG TPA: methyltransferase domain-containing protein [bacterium]|jgi:2-polyprenyl-3-methyl-5-hydroxy-6-metoxy-1,4-benzoquinol methylase
MTTQPEKPVAKDAWNTIADRYASMIDRKAHNAFYDKPANFSLLPDISGKKVLDAGCGPGAYAEKLLELGAEVTCIDSSTKTRTITNGWSGTPVF